jgi:hypothetical protein
MKKKSVKKKPKMSETDQKIILEYAPCKCKKNIDSFVKIITETITTKLPEMIMFNDIPITDIKYEEECSKFNMGLHIGQRKLLLNEIQFLTEMYKHDSDIEYCIYVGSAPGNKTYLLSQLFPHIKFILIDPNIFELNILNKKTGRNIKHRSVKHPDIIHLYSAYPYKGNIFDSGKKLKDLSKDQSNKLIDFIKTSTYKIFIIEDYMSNEIAQLLTVFDKCGFISDIRSNVEMTDCPSDFDVVWNMSMMYNWINIIKPSLSVFKFRTPFYNDGILDFTKLKHIYADTFDISKKYGIDFIKNYKNKEFIMSSSDLYIQPWCGKSSTEMRSIIYAKDINKLISYDTIEIENRFLAYNKVFRVLFHENKNSNKAMHFCKCNDCSIENNIWTNYLKLNIKQDIIESVLDAVKLTGIVTNRPLEKVHTNTIWQPLKDLTEFKKMYNIMNKGSEYRKNFAQKGNKGVDM